MDSFDREEKSLIDDYENGLLTLEEFNHEIRELNRDYNEMAQASAQRAYDDEMRQW